MEGEQRKSEDGEIMEFKENGAVDGEPSSDNERCLCDENCLESTDGNYPDYSYRKRVNFLYTQITGIGAKSINVCYAISKQSI